MKVKHQAIHFWFINAQYFKKHCLSIQLDTKHLVLLKYCRKIKVIWEVSATEAKIILKNEDMRKCLYSVHILSHSFCFVYHYIHTYIHTFIHWLTWAIQQLHNTRFGILRYQLSLKYIPHIKEIITTCFHFYFCIAYLSMSLQGSKVHCEKQTAVSHLWQFVNEGMNICCFSCFFNFLLTNKPIVVSILNIFSNAAVKQNGFLWH